MKGEDAEVSPEDFVVYFGMFVVKVEPSALCSLSELQGRLFSGGLRGGSLLQLVRASLRRPGWRGS